MPWVWAISKAETEKSPQGDRVRARAETCAHHVAFTRQSAWALKLLLSLFPSNTHSLWGSSISTVKGIC